jgi:hypothetical protein
VRTKASFSSLLLYTHSWKMLLLLDFAYTAFRMIHNSLVPPVSRHLLPCRLPKNTLSLHSRSKTPSIPSFIINAASAGVAIPPAENITTGNLPSFATSLNSSTGAASSFAIE